MFSQFLTQLTTSEPPPSCVNPYAVSLPESEKRRHNLQRYLTQMAGHQPRLLLVGEAPGYRGCRISGIPFVSRQILRSGIPAWGLFGATNGYLIPGDLPGIEAEASATILWQALANLDRPPLLWNACPWHPHQPAKPASNRTPASHEVAAGEPFLRQLLALFAVHTVVAVGNQAARALTNWGIPHRAVRHPAHGGKQGFVEGVTKLGIAD